MAARILDTYLEERLIAERRATGADRYDEVWDGEYVMSPLANNEHQQLAGQLTAIFYQIVGMGEGVWCQPGANVSDQEVDWTHNYRCPDVVVVLPGSKAENRHTHWYGGPDFIVEIVSEGDASRKKFDFYGKIGVREALIVDRDPWSLELYRLADSSQMRLVGQAMLNAPSSLMSEVLNAEFRLVTKGNEPCIEVRQPSTGRSWQT